MRRALMYLISLKLASPVIKFYKAVEIKVYIKNLAPRRFRNDSKTLEHLNDLKKVGGVAAGALLVVFAGGKLRKK